MSDLAGSGALDLSVLEHHVFPLDKINEAELVVLLNELKTDLNAYLASTPPTVRTPPRSALVESEAESAAVEAGAVERLRSVVFHPAAPRATIGRAKSLPTAPLASSKRREPRLRNSSGGWRY